MGFAAAAEAQSLAGRGPCFPADAPWYQDISSVPADSESEAIIAWRMQPGQDLSTDQVQSIVHLVSSSVEGMDPDDVR